MVIQESGKPICYQGLFKIRSRWILSPPLEFNLPPRQFIYKTKQSKIKFGIPQDNKGSEPLLMLIIEGLLEPSLYTTLPSLKLLKMFKSGCSNWRIMLKQILQSFSWAIKATLLKQEKSNNKWPMILLLLIN